MAEMRLNKTGYFREDILKITFLKILHPICISLRTYLLSAQLDDIINLNNLAGLCKFRQSPLG